MNKVVDEYLIVVNPNAGGGQCKKDWPEIENLIRRRNLKYHAVFTQYRHHAINLTAKYINQGYRKIIVVGGDGTINEVVNGIFSNYEEVNHIYFGVIMMGTGNDWGRMFNIPPNYQKAIDIIVREKKFKQDVGKVSYFLGTKKHYRYFINTAGIGFDAMVVQNTNLSKDKGKSGKFSYLTTLFKTLLNYKTLDVKIAIEGKELKGSKLFTMNVGIGKFSGGGMQQVPHAIIDDGLFDIMLVNKIRKTKIVYKIKKLYDGNIHKIKEVNMFKGQNLLVSSKDKVMLEVDGESLGHAPFEFEVIDQKLNVIVN